MTAQRSRSWQQDFLSHPVADRLAQAQGLREQSIRAQAGTETVSDVNPAAVDNLMTRLQTDLLVHGHTHRPMVHRWHARTRWVLGDWGVSPPRGSVLPLTAATVAPA